MGDVIPIAWRNLARRVELHTRELVLVAGAPGAGKSVLATNLVMQRELEDQPILYVAQDSAPSVLARLAALELMLPISEVQYSLRNNPEEVLDPLLDAKPNLFLHDGALTFEGIEHRVRALKEFYGTGPKILVIDNLIDTLVPGKHHQEVGFYAEILNRLKQLSLEEDVCVIALHHVTRRGGETGYSAHGLGTKRLMMTDLLYSGEREAEHVLGVYHSPDANHIYVQVLKQRDGAADPEGGLFAKLGWVPEEGRLPT